MTPTTRMLRGAPLSEPAFLKTDVLGRVKRTRGPREQILDAYERRCIKGREVRRPW